MKMQRSWCLYLALILILLVPVLSPSKANYSDYAEASGAQSNKVYLPLILKPPFNEWTGMHLGNRVAGLWEPDMFDAIDPRDGDGTWPSTIVVLSTQLYFIVRTPNLCSVSFAWAHPNAVDSGAFDYVKAAAKNGARVIVRLYPSPGNFIDYNDPNWSNHRLSAGPPIPGHHCADGPELRWRSALDLAMEMQKIQEHNVNHHGFEVFGFIPANEPNLEWYTQPPGGGSNWSNPNVMSAIAWQDMDAYFAAVYDHVQNIKGSLNIRVFTPPMSPNLFAEGKDFFSSPETCANRLINGVTKGYELMPVTYGTKNNGVAWHNYWVRGRELYNLCENNGGHVSLYFPHFMKQAIHPFYRPAIITEADIGSPKTQSLPQGQIPWGLTDFLDKDIDPAATSYSMRRFFHSEYCFGNHNYGAPPRIAAWLLSDNTSNPEHDWHEAYRDGPVTRPWFNRWWNIDGENFYSGGCPQP